MRRFGLTSARFAVLLAVLAIRPVAAQSLSAGRDVFTINDCDAAISIRFVAQTRPVAIRTGDVAARPAASPPGWTIEWERPSSTESTIKEYASAGHIKEGCPAPGLYLVPLTIYAEDQTTAPLSITLVRVADPLLDIPASVTFVADRVWGPPPPVALLLRETVAGAPDVRVSLLGGELKSTNGEASGIALEPQAGSAVVKAGETARVLLAPTRPPPPGAYTTRLMLSSAALKQAATVEVTYKARLASYYLLAIIAAGIGLGWLVNVFLSARAALDAALLAGLRAMQSLTRRATPQRDPAVQQRLLAVANLLQSNLEDVDTQDEVKARVGEAEAQAKEIENKAVEAAVALSQALAATRGLFRPAGQPIDALLATCLAAPLGELDALQRAADAGDVEQTAARLQDFNRDLPARLLPLIQGLVADIRAELDGLGKLPPGTGLPPARDAMRDRIAEIYQSQELAPMLKAADALARQLRAWMDLVAPAALAALWRQAAQALAPKAVAVSQRVGIAADQAEQLRRATPDPLARLASLAAACRSVTAALADASADRADVAAALEQGDVLAAARLLAGQEPAERLEAQAAVEAEPDQPRALVLAEQGPVAVLRIKPLIPLGQDSMLALRWLGEPPPQERTAWQCYPVDAADVQPVATGAIVRPKQAGFVTIVLELDNVRRAEIRTYAGEVAEQRAYAVVAREGRRARALIAVATALLTAFAGYEIFLPNWFGTVGDCFAAFLWGFFGQFGLDRIRELARPLLSKPLSI